MKKVKLHYSICDCEHDGDISYAKNEVIEAGGTYEGYYWENEGRDCDGGEAWITFTCDESKVDEIKAKLGDVW